MATQTFLRRKRASGSLISKINRAINHGWKPGLGPVGEWARHRPQAQNGGAK